MVVIFALVIISTVGLTMVIMVAQATMIIPILAPGGLIYILHLTQIRAQMVITLYQGIIACQISMQMISPTLMHGVKF